MVQVERVGRDAVVEELPEAVGVFGLAVAAAASGPLALARVGVGVTVLDTRGADRGSR